MPSSTKNSGDDDPFAKLMAQLKGVDTAAKSRSSQNQIPVKRPVAPQVVALRQADGLVEPGVKAPQFPEHTVSSNKSRASTDVPPTSSATAQSQSVASTLPSQATPKSPEPQGERSGRSESLSKRFQKVNSSDQQHIAHPAPTTSGISDTTALFSQQQQQQGHKIQSTVNSDAPSLVCGVSAYPPLTTSEMIQEGAPQHFVAEADSESILRPLLTTTGCVAMSDIVGRVVSVPESFDDPSGSNGVFTSFMVEYTVPFSHTTPVKCSLEVRAYGPVLSVYAANELVVDDIVHVTGHLLPTEQGMAVVALPWGGNITVVLTPKVNAAATLDTSS
jgi:hypothetical protein